jgi:hypothetical protein
VRSEGYIWDVVNVRMDLYLARAGMLEGIQSMFGVQHFDHPVSVSRESERSASKKRRIKIGFQNTNAIASKIFPIILITFQ